jgi:diguanylate cyclase (GGDEF)-like protein
MAAEGKHRALRDEVREKNYRDTEQAVAVGRGFVIVFLFLYVNIARPEGWPLALFNWLFLGASAYNLFIFVYTKKSAFFSVRLTVFSMNCDMLATAVGLYFTGGAQSPFLFLWYLTLFTAGARFGYVKSFFLQVPMGAIYVFFVYHAALGSGPVTPDRLAPGLFSLSAVSLFGSIFFREERYTLGVLEGLQRESITDRLTGLYNYAFFMDELKKEQARADRTGSPFSLAIFDLDFFKKVNDTYGHETGNALLKEVAAVLAANARQMDTVARYGGEEFIVLMPDSGDAGLEVAERIRTKIEEAGFSGISRGPVRITISGGVATYPQDASTMAGILDRADFGLYRAKSSGRNRVCSYESVKCDDERAKVFYY